MMPILARDALHKVQLLRLLTEIVDDSVLSHKVAFKGGTCAAMLGWLDRFSVDLDFDFVEQVDKDELRNRLHGIFESLGLEIKDQSKHVLEFFLKYPSPVEQRNTLKLDILDFCYKENQYEVSYLPDIDRLVRCHTKETAFAHKLVALTDRFEKHGSIAGRDLYDIHHFFVQGFRYRIELIRERTGMELIEFFEKTIAFVENQMTQTAIDQDINQLLPLEIFTRVRKGLKQETIMLLRDELGRLQNESKVQLSP